MSARRIIVVARSANEAESARSLLAQTGADIDAVVVEGDPDDPLPQLGEPPRPELDHIERLATIGTLTAGTAHEVNNLLTHLFATLYDARRTLSCADEGQNLATTSRGRLDSDLGGALDACFQLRALARGITQFSSPSGDEVMDADVGTLLDEAIQIVEPELGSRATVDRESAADVPRIRVNPTKICQVFVNLLKNAGHAITESSRETGRIGVAASADGDRVRIDVTDDGCGIPPALAARIFEPFFTSKGDRAGTGLGLSVSRTIVDEHGGEIRFSSEVGVGTTFSVMLPAASRRDN